MKVSDVLYLWFLGRGIRALALSTAQLKPTALFQIIRHSTNLFAHTELYLGSTSAIH